MNFTFAFYQQYQFFSYFAGEYVGRLKAHAASIILNLASLKLESSNLTENEDKFFTVERDFIIQTASDIVRPLLNVINQERVQFFKKWSA